MHEDIEDQLQTIRAQIEALMGQAIENDEEPTELNKLRLREKEIERRLDIIRQTSSPEADNMADSLRGQMLELHDSIRQEVMS